MKQLIKNIYNNVLSLYRDFFHWNIAKICIEIWALLLGIWFALPFFLVLVFLWFMDSIPWIGYTAGWLKISPNEVNENIVFIIIEFIFLLCTITMLILWWSYKAVLRVKLVKEYYEQNSFFHKLYDGAKRKIFGVHVFKPSIYKSYFSFDKTVFFCYVKLLGWIWLYLLIPFLIFILAVVLVIVGHKWNMELLTSKFVESPINIYSIFIFVTFIGAIFLFMYLLYRLYFSLMILVDHAEKVDYSNAKSLIRESFSLTKGFQPLLKFLWVYIVFWAILIPFIMVSVYVDDKRGDHLSFPEAFFSIFMFLVFTWYFDMVFFSLYKNYFEKRGKI